MEYVVIFLFLFAVLAAAYFYLERAKHRTAKSDESDATGSRVE